MAIDPNDYYGTLTEAVTYFEDRLHETDFLSKSSEMQEKALLAATRDIDALVFSGYKTPVYTLLQSNPDATDDEIAAADATQALQFPRDGDVAVPEQIKIATWEIAHERLRGRDPSIEKENLVLTSDGAGSTRFSMDRTGPAPAWLRNGVVSFVAWRYLMPYLDDNNTFEVRRSS